MMLEGEKGWWWLYGEYYGIYHNTARVVRPSNSENLENVCLREREREMREKERI